MLTITMTREEALEASNVIQAAIAHLKGLRANLDDSKVSAKRIDIDIGTLSRLCVALELGSKIIID